MAAFVVDDSNARIVGYVEDAAVASEAANGLLVVSTAEDLNASSITLDSMKALYASIDAAGTALSNVTDKAEAATILFDAISKINLETLAKLDAQSKDKVKEAKPRKVRDSKLQRMAAAFRAQNDDGTYKSYTLEELMTIAGIPTDKMRTAKVYISILRSPDDRFVMNIEKCDDTKRYRYAPASNDAQVAQAA